MPPMMCAQTVSVEVEINSSRVLAMSGAALLGVRVVTIQFVGFAVPVLFISQVHALFT